MTELGRTAGRWSLLLFAAGCGGDLDALPALAPSSGGAGARAGEGGAAGLAAASGSGGSPGAAAGRAGSCASVDSGHGGSSSGASGADCHGAASGSAGSQGGGSTAGGGATASGPMLGGCSLFPATDAWNRDISAEPVDADWTRRLAELVGDVNIHPDYGGGGSELYGIPINVVPEHQLNVGVHFYWYGDESDPGPYPFPDPGSVAIEGNDPLECLGDCHLLVLQQGSCQLFEGYACYYQAGWQCGGGARWDLSRDSYGQRTKGWTSADAAGLAITPGIVRYDEVRAGEILHALRFTVPCTRPNYVEPATHHAVPGGCNPHDPNAPPMGLRVRLRADYDLSGASPSARVVLRAMQRYGMILADNGSSFYFQGEANPGWQDEDIEPLKDVPASAFEVIALPPMER